MEGPWYIGVFGKVKILDQIRTINRVQAPDFKNSQVGRLKCCRQCWTNLRQGGIRFQQLYMVSWASTPAQVTATWGFRKEPTGHDGHRDFVRYG